jgi:regulation of enolase protein 1 (concanavalin A-like superfamily)
VSADAEGVTLIVPGKAHVFDPTVEEKTAPRALTEVDGDFTVQVKILGNIRPGTKPLNKKLGMTFQGAGILLWQDNSNFLRVERTSTFMRERVQQIRVETCKDGKPGGARPVALRNEAPVILRLERRGSEVVITYSYDGKTWLPVVKSLAVPFPAKLNVGISASNLSPRPLSARFEDFVLTPGSGKAG